MQTFTELDTKEEGRVRLNANFTEAVNADATNATAAATAATAAASALSAANAAQSTASAAQPKAGVLALAGFSGITGTLPAVNVADLSSTYLTVATAASTYVTIVSAAASYQPLSAALSTFSSNGSAFYIDRANHTGTQLASTISDFSTAADARAAIAVAALVDSSPGTLDTLNELAAALGDDPNFATTVAASIGLKLAKASNLSDLANAATARTNLGLAIGTDVQAYNATLTTWAGKTAPTGTVLGTTDTQTVTNKTLGAGTVIPWEREVVISGKGSDATTGTGKAFTELAYAVTLTGVLMVSEVASSGAAVVADVNEGGVSVLSTKLSIDAGETSSATAATPAVISDSALAAGARITFDLDQVGSLTPGQHIIVTLIGTRTLT